MECKLIQMVLSGVLGVGAVYQLLVINEPPLQTNLS